MKKKQSIAIQESPASVEEQVLAKIRSMPETQLHRDVIQPLLSAIGATHIECVHGPDERGKDFKYILTNAYDQAILSVCQVKNEQFTGKTATEHSFAGTVSQLNLAASTLVLNPITGEKQLPDEVSLWTTYPIPERATADASPLLQQLKEKRIRIIGPEKLIELLKRSKRLFDSLAFSGDVIVRELKHRLADHTEASAFDLATSRSLDSFYINLALIPTNSLLHQIDRGEIAPANFASDRNSQLPVDIAKVIIAQCMCVAETCDKSLITLNIEGLKIPLGGMHVQMDMAEAIETLARSTTIFEVSCVVHNPKAFVAAVVSQFRETVRTSLASLRLAIALPAMHAAMQYLQVCDTLLSTVRDQTDIDAFRENFGRPEDARARLRYPPLPTAVLSTMSENLLLVGGPGAGKTSISKRLVRELLDANIRAVFFPCSRITAKSMKLESQILKYLQEANRTSTEASEFLKSADFIVLDGADEAATYSTTLVKEIQALAASAVRSAPISLPQLAIPAELSTRIHWIPSSASIRLMAPLSTKDQTDIEDVNTSPCLRACISELAKRGQKDCFQFKALHEVVIPASLQSVAAKENAYSSVRFKRALSADEISAFLIAQSRGIVNEQTEKTLRMSLTSFFRDGFQSVSWPIECCVADHVTVASIDPRLKDRVKYDRTSCSVEIVSSLTAFEFDLACVGNEPCVAEALRKLKDATRNRRRVIVTTRPGRSLNLLGFVVLRLLPFSDGQLSEFFKAWFSETPHLGELMLDFIKKRSSARIREIARTPMIATLMASLLEKGFDLPASKTEVYEKRFELLLGRWDAARDVLHRSTLRSRDKMFLLSELAFVLHKAHRRDFDRNDVNEIWRNKFLIHYSEMSVEAVLDELEVSNGVIEKVADQRWSLGHLSYQEYLTAFHVIRTQKISSLTKLVSDSWWRQVVVFCVGLTGDASPFVSSYLRYGRLSVDRELLEELLVESRGTPGDVVAFVEDTSDKGLESDIDDFGDDRETFDDVSEEYFDDEEDD